MSWGGRRCFGSICGQRRSCRLGSRCRHVPGVPRLASSHARTKRRQGQRRCRVKRVICMPRTQLLVPQYTSWSRCPENRGGKSTTGVPLPMLLTFYSLSPHFALPSFSMRHTAYNSKSGMVAPGVRNSSSGSMVAEGTWRTHPVRRPIAETSELQVHNSDHGGRFSAMLIPSAFNSELGVLVLTTNGIVKKEAKD